MGNLFKLGTGELSRREKRKTRGDYYAKVRIEAYKFKTVRLCSDAAVSEKWLALLQAQVDRRAAGEALDRDALRELPHRLLRSLRLVGPQQAYSFSVIEYVSQLQTNGRSPKYVANIQQYLTAIADAWVYIKKRGSAYGKGEGSSAPPGR